MDCNDFNISYTQLVKGVAILLLLVHHLFGVKYVLPIGEVDFNQLITCFTKVCVALFTILSGYGITKSFVKKNISNINFVILHIKRLMINYWFIYIPVFVLSFFIHSEGIPSEIYGYGKIGIINFFLDFFGMKALFNTPTLNQTWWYMEVVIICYLFYPLFYKCIKRSKMLSLIISIMPCIVADVIVFNTGFRYTGRAIFYIFPFVLGMILASDGMLDNVVNYCNNKSINRINIILISVFGMIFFSMLSTQFMFIPHVFFALSIIVLLIAIRKSENIIIKFLELLGKHSMNIFLTHSFFYCYFIGFSNMIYSIKYKTIKYIVLLIISLCVSIEIEKLKLWIVKKR